MRKQSIYSSRILSRGSRPNNAPTEREGDHNRTTNPDRAGGRNRRLAIYAGIIALILACILLPCATKRCANKVRGGRTINHPISDGLKQGMKGFTQNDKTVSARDSIRGSLKRKQIKKDLDTIKKSETKVYDKKPEPKVYDFGTKLELITDPNAE